VVFTEKHKYGFRDLFRKLKVIFDAHSKEFIYVKLQQTVVLTVLDKYIGAVCIVQKCKKIPMLKPILVFYIEILE